MRKDRILERDHKDYVRAERDVLTSVVHPYIVTLRYSFQARRCWNAEVLGRCVLGCRAAGGLRTRACSRCLLAEKVCCCILSCCSSFSSSFCLVPQTPKKLYLVLDFINGGHLFFQLYRQVGAGDLTGSLARSLLLLLLLLLLPTGAAGAPVSSHAKRTPCASSLQLPSCTACLRAHLLSHWLDALVAHFTLPGGLLSSTFFGCRARSTRRLPGCTPRKSCWPSRTCTPWALCTGGRCAGGSGVCTGGRLQTQLHLHCSSSVCHP